MASQSKPMYIGIMYFKFYDWALQTGRDHDDASSIASHIAQTIGNMTYHTMEQKSIFSLIAFFKNTICTIALPTGLFAHLHQTALYCVKNGAVVAMINQSD